MDYRYQPYSYMQQMDVNRMPFYMTYPMQNLYLTEMECEQDCPDGRQKRRSLLFPCGAPQTPSVAEVNNKMIVLI